MSDLKNKIRAKTIGSTKVFKSRIIEFDEMEIEIREPSVKVWGQILKAVTGIEKDNTSGKMEYDKYLIWSVIYCAFVPGTDEKIYEDTDYETLESYPKSGFVGEFSEIAMDMMNSNQEEVEKKLDETASDNQS